MPSDTFDARALLEVAPDQFVTERARLVKEARAAKDRNGAKFYQSLKRPGVALWAVLAAGDDAENVGKVMAATTELGAVQAGGSNAGSLSAATKQRRKVLEAFVDKAVKALAKWDKGAEKRRSEIRTLVDQLSRNPELADAWVDGTLRELPDDQFGFGAFAGMEVTSAERAERPATTKTTSKAKIGGTSRATRSAEPAKAEPKRDLAAERAEKAKRAERARQAKQEVATAARELTAAERKVDVARKAFRQAEKELQAAEAERDAAAERHEEATAELETARSSSGSR